MFAATPSIFESLVLKSIFIGKPLQHQPGTRLPSDGKRQKMGRNRRKIGERTEPRGGLGRRGGGGAPSSSSLPRLPRSLHWPIFPAFPPLRGLVPGYYNICITHKLNFIVILFLGDGNKYHVTMTSQQFQLQIGFQPLPPFVFLENGQFSRIRTTNQSFVSHILNFVGL